VQGRAFDDDKWAGYVNCDANVAVCQRAASLYLVLGASYACLLLIGLILVSDPNPAAVPGQVMIRSLNFEAMS
jgi:hypothetical protein